MRDPREILIRPLMTEKSMQQKEALNTVAFRVRPDANKVEIRQAVEKLFNVRVAKVNTLRVLGKARRRGYVGGMTPDWKKAMVTLREGNTIEMPTKPTVERSTGGSSPVVQSHASTSGKGSS